MPKGHLWIETFRLIDGSILLSVRWVVSDGLSHARVCGRHLCFHSSLFHNLVELLDSYGRHFSVSHPSRCYNCSVGNEEQPACSHVRMTTMNNLLVVAQFHFDCSLGESSLHI